MNWTRAHDAHIARECEGLEIEYRVSGVGNSGPVDWCVKSPMPFTPHGGEPEDVWVPIKTYSTDIAACIRAAEAWRKRGEGRTVKIEWDGPDVKAGLGDRVGGWHQWFSPCDKAATALAWALYRATERRKDTIK